MKLRRTKSFQAEVSTSSLNDIMFFLLLFFLIVSTLANPNVIKLLLPKSTASQSINKEQVAISVTADKKIYMNDREITFDQYIIELGAIASRMQEPTIVLRMAQNLNIQDLVDFLEIGASKHVKIVLATDKK
jgi:biopolymer transport protein ExbD